MKSELSQGCASVDDNVWEYPFGDLDEDDDLFFNKPEVKYRNHSKD